MHLTMHGYQKKEMKGKNVYVIVESFLVCQ